MIDWDELASFAARVVRARSYEGIGDRCARAHHAGEDVDRFAAGRELKATIAGRAAARVSLGAAAVPAAVSSGLQHNQKPFHLWNVERAVHDAPYELEPQPPLRLGRGAVLPEELRVPRRLVKATHELREWVRARAMLAAMAKRERAHFLKLLRMRLPYGRSEEEPREERDEEAAPRPGRRGSAPPVPERVGPFVRTPGPRPAREVEDQVEDDGAGLEPPRDDDEA